MSETIQLNIQLFGCLRQYNNNKSLVLTATSGETVTQIKQRLIARLTELQPEFKDVDVIGVSAIALKDNILHDDFKLLTSGDLFVLPPVCGG